jgi:hypothetical protein
MVRRPRDAPSRLRAPADARLRGSRLAEALRDGAALYDEGGPQCADPVLRAVSPNRPEGGAYPPTLMYFSISFSTSGRCYRSVSKPLRTSSAAMCWNSICAFSPSAWARAGNDQVAPAPNRDSARRRRGDDPSEKRPPIVARVFHGCLLRCAWLEPRVPTWTDRGPGNSLHRGARPVISLFEEQRDEEALVRTGPAVGQASRAPHPGLAGRTSCDGGTLGGVPTLKKWAQPTDDRGAPDAVPRRIRCSPRTSGRDTPGDAGCEGRGTR